MNAGEPSPPGRRGAIARAVFLAIAVVVAAQAVLGTAALAADFWQPAGVGLQPRVLGTTDDRLRRDLGADFAIARALREEAREHEWALVRPPFTPAEANGRPESLAARLTRLRHAVFPTPVLMLGAPDLVAAVEAGIRPGQTVLVLVLAGDPSPAGRPQWVRLRQEAGFQLWRLAKA